MWIVQTKRFYSNCFPGHIRFSSEKFYDSVLFKVLHDFCSNDKTKLYRKKVAKKIPLDTDIAVSTLPKLFIQFEKVEVLLEHFFPQNVPHDT